MKTHFLFLFAAFLFLFSYPANAQSGNIQQLKREVQAASGKDRLEKLIKLTDAYLNEGNYNEAQKTAEEAADFAPELYLPEIRAAALNREGKAMMMGGKKRAALKFEKSLKLQKEARSTNKTLALDNLNQLKTLATNAGRDKEIRLLDEQIARVKSISFTGSTEVPPPPPPPSPEELDKKIQAQLATIQNAISKDNASLNDRKEMEDKLAAQEAQIAAMSADQMKAHMRFMAQKTMIDSIVNKSALDSLNVVNTSLALKEAESTRYFYLAIMAGLLLLAAGAFYFFVRARQNAKLLEEKNKTIREEQERSEDLLLNILPSLVAQELKKKGHTDAQYFEDASVLFADSVGFSKIAEQVTPQQLVADLDACFRAFDTIMAEYKLEKIKTIGDAYMCAGGITGKTGNCLPEMVNAAKDMQRWLDKWNAERQALNLPRYDARIGIHNGPLVAGVVGSKKFAFDVWGDTVNIAARVEQAGSGGKINISGVAYETVKQFFPCSYRGKLPMKNKGEIDMYFVEN